MWNILPNINLYKVQLSKTQGWNPEIRVEDCVAPDFQVNDMA